MVDNDMIINPETVVPNQVYHIITQSLIPRPIAWVLTENSQGNFNLAPFSYFTAISSDPPLLLLSIGKKPDGTEKDTRVNIKRTGKMVIHIAHQGQVDLVNATSASLAYAESEVEQQGLSLVPFADFTLPRIDGCFTAFACELYQYTELGEAQQAIIFAEIKTIYLQDDKVEMTPKGRFVISANALDPLARLGGGEYAGLTEAFTLKRPK